MQCTLLQVVCTIIWVWLAKVVSGTQNIVMRNVSKYPACVADEDCMAVTLERGEDYKCFQYMCYPWNSGQEKGAFRTCKKRSDCKKLLNGEGGDGEDGDCYRHPDRRTVHTGICLDRREIVLCFDHESCDSRLACTNGVCGDMEYLKALGDMQCEDDDLCEDLLLGSQCCFDIHGGVESWARGGAEVEWGKTCCDNEYSPVKRPRQDLTRQEMTKLDKKIRTYYTPWGLDQTICEGLDYAMMIKLSSCLEFTTSTTTTTTNTAIATRRTTKSVIKKSKQQETSNSALVIVSNLLFCFMRVIAVLL